MTVSLLSVKEVAALLRLCRNSVSKLIDCGELSSVVVSPAGSKREHRRVTAQSVKDFIARRMR